MPTAKKARNGPNPFRIEGDVAYISLFNRRREIVAEALIDKADLSLVQSHCWSPHWSKFTRSYYVRTNIIRDGRATTLLLHRLLLGPALGVQVDHVNHNSLDNRRSNLREATAQANARNRRGAQVNSSLGVRNVVWSKRDQLFIVRLTVGRKTMDLARVHTIEEAKSVAAEARRVHFGSDQ